jgi:hypothetical protein
LTAAVETAGDDIDRSPSGNYCCNDYLKVIVEVFREIEAECTGPLTAG